MTPKEKAKELCNKFLRTYKVDLYPPFNSASQEAKQCALIAADEILNVVSRYNASWHWPMDTANEFYYWQEVKQEIEKL
jgi:hypothetical protein